jgi:hypothetical protein
LNAGNVAIESSPINGGRIARLTADRGGHRSQQARKEVFAAMWSGENGRSRRDVKARGLEQISDSRAIEKIVDEVVAANAPQVADYRSGSRQKRSISLVGPGDERRRRQGQSVPGQRVAERKKFFFRGITTKLSSVTRAHSRASAPRPVPGSTTSSMARTQPLPPGPSAP